MEVARNTEANLRETFEQARQSWPSWAPRTWMSRAYRPRRWANNSNTQPLPRCRIAAGSARQIIRSAITVRTDVFRHNPHLVQVI